MRTALAAIVFFATFPAVSPAQVLGNWGGAPAPVLSDCGCNDVREMRDRWCSARAAKAEYQRIVNYLNSEAAKTGKSRMYSLADKKMINQKCVQEAINAVSDRGVVKGTANTHENLPPESLFKEDCRVEVTSTNHTACLKQIVENHEGFHRHACINRNEAGGIIPILLQGEIGGLLGDTKYTLTSAQFAAEEAASYATEMQLLAARWQDLQKRCPSTVFQPVLSDSDTAGQRVWDNSQPDSSGDRRYRMYDLTEDPCPSRPRPAKSECTLR